MIEDAGFDGIEAANGDEAIQILESCSDVRVVFTDFHMPDSMDGANLLMPSVVVAADQKL
jgi:CheY-like chemotaxis protein